MAFPGGNVTRFSLNGGMWHPYGSFAGKTEQEADQGAGAPPSARKRKIITPDGKRLYVTDDELRFLRAEWEARARQEGQATLLEQRRIKAKGRKRAKTRTFETPAELLVPDEAPIPIPKSFIPEAKAQDIDIARLIRDKIEAEREMENDALLLLLMLS